MSKFANVPNQPAGGNPFCYAMSVDLPCPEDRLVDYKNALREVDIDARQAVQLKLRGFLEQARDKARLPDQACDVSIKRHGGCVLAFTRPEDADKLAECLLKLADAENNEEGKKQLLNTCFRIGVARGDVHASYAGFSGNAVDAAMRLQTSGCCGEVRVTQDVFQKLPTDLQISYGDQEVVQHEGEDLRFHRRRITEPADWEDEPKPIQVRGRSVVCIDMARYTQVITFLREQMGLSDPEVLVHSQIRKLLDRAFSLLGVPFQARMLQWSGDGAILFFRSSDKAHQLAKGFLQVAADYNKDKQQHDTYRCFRVGIARSTLTKTDEGWTGEAFHRARRLESAGCCGEVRVSKEFLENLSEEFEACYGAIEDLHVPAKMHESTIAGHRYPVTKHAPWEKPPSAPRPHPIAPTAPRKEQCFVISPINANDTVLGSVLRFVIQPACKKTGFKAVPAYDIPGHDRMHMILRQLDDAPVVMAYLGKPTPDWNPNVMIEVGYRLATGKPMVLVGHRPSKIPGRDRPTSIADLLPFNLKVRHVIELPEHEQDIEEEAAQYIEKLVAEVRFEQDNKADKGAGILWKYPHPITEVRITGAEAEFTEASDRARKLFGEDVIGKGATVDQLVQSLQERMTLKQYKAFVDEQSDLLFAIQNPQNPFKRRTGVPIAKVPVVFKEPNLTGDDDTNGGRAYLPIVIRYSKQGDEVNLRVLYLDVTRKIEDKGGYFVCERT